MVRSEELIYETIVNYLMAGDYYFSADRRLFHVAGRREFRYNKR